MPSKKSELPWGVGPNGEKYYGNFVFKEDGRASEGQGVCAYPDGSDYIGQLQDGRRHGSGAHLYENGDKFVGKWTHGKMESGLLSTTFKKGNANGAKY